MEKPLLSESVPYVSGKVSFSRPAIEHAHMGNRFEVETPHGRQEALTVPKPFIDPTKDIPKL